MLYKTQICSLGPDMSGVRPCAGYELKEVAAWERQVCGIYKHGWPVTVWRFREVGEPRFEHVARAVPVLRYISSATAGSGCSPAAVS